MLQAAALANWRSHLFKPPLTMPGLWCTCYLTKLSKLPRAKGLLPRLRALFFASGGANGSSACRASEHTESNLLFQTMGTCGSTPKSAATAESSRGMPQPDSPGVLSLHAEAIRVDRALFNGATPALSRSRTAVLRALCLDCAGRPWLIHKC